MASSSSSSRPSHFVAASSSQSWNHDVFLSFRGGDTRKTFVDHLYSALDLNGIHTYKDDEALPRGESIGPSLLKAIKESRIAVVVFSKNYADSSWCLDELTTIMDCRDERGQIVMPIFYNVDPSDVRKQKGEFGEAFSKHELENNINVDSWRTALVAASNISGWEPQHIANGHESKCIKEIVDTISLRLFHLMSSTSVDDLIGIKTRMQDLTSQLEIGSGGVRMVGIWGVGGGGKTTLASSVYDEISHDFDGCCFVGNIREESKKYGLEILQERILLDVLKPKLVVVESAMMKSRLRHRNVLIVLDDVDCIDHLKALAGSHDWFGEGSRIIITTRDNHLLNAHKVDLIYNISLLNDDEAVQLFRRHASQGYKPIANYDMLSLEVVSYAGGLPLALNVLGSFLCDKDISEWRSALARLKDIPDTDIVEKLKISYDGLKSVEKELFLDIACFFRWRSKYEAMEIFDACGFHPVIGLKVLIQKALITISNGNFDMHDLVQDMGHYIVRGEDPNSPEKHSRVWLNEDVLTICNRNTTTENDKTEALLVYSDYAPPNLLEVVAHIKKLRLLDVYDFGNEHGIQLVEGLEFLSNELRWITWHGYPASSLPTNFQPMKLGVLKLVNGLQKQLWKGYKRLPCLKVLDLGGSRNLIRIPDLDGLPCLERMILRGCRNLEEIHPSITYRERLVYLDLFACSKLKIFPAIVRFKKLETFILSYCCGLRKFPEIQGSMDSLVELCLDKSGIEVVPSSIGQYCTNLVSLNLHHCDQLRSIAGNFRLLKHLKVLHLKGCRNLEKLPEDLFDIECCLEELSLPSMRQRQAPSSQHLITKPFKNIMRCMGSQFSHPGLVGLEFHDLPRFIRKLDLSGCNLVDRDIPPDIGEFSNLQVLNLSSNNFSRLHSSLSRLPQLKFLNLSWCKSLVQLPELPLSIAVFVADGCDSLEIVGDFPSYCKWLWKVSIMRSPKLGNDEQSAIDGDRVLQSMLQGNAIDNHVTSLCLPGHEMAKGFVPSLVKEGTFILHLPQDWYSDFSGFLICVAFMNHYSSWRPLHFTMTMKEMGMDSQSDLWVEPMSHYDAAPGTWVGYVSFSLLWNTEWWSSSYNQISFSFHDIDDSWLLTGCGITFVPKKSSKSDPHDAIDFSGFWDEESDYTNTFSIKDDSESALEILWRVSDIDIDSSLDPTW